MKLIAIPGSLRADANTRKVLESATAYLPADVEVDVYDGYGDLPIFDEDLESPPATAVVEFRDRLAAADALLVVTPEYNASIPGGLKNAIDWASRPAGESVLANMPAAVIANSNSPFGGTWAGEQLRRALTFATADVIDAELALGEIKSGIENGRLVDPEKRGQVREIVAKLLSVAGARVDEDRDLSRASTT